jgi:hypothetical protein
LVYVNINSKYSDTMKKLKPLIVITFLIISMLSSRAIYSQTYTPPKTLKLLWETEASLTTCESVCYHAAGNELFASSINGNPTDKDGNGFISKLSVTGEITNLNWITGLNAPKGMGIFNRKLYVTDIDRLVEIDIDKASVIKEYPVPDAKFLNDITIDPDGNVYISDMATSKIHRLANGMMETWLTNANIISPNGLFYEEGEILIGTKKGIFSTNIEDKRTWQVIMVEGGIDGLEGAGNGNYIISDWNGKVQLVNEHKDPVVLLNTTDQKINAADIEFDPVSKTLFVPTFFDNRVMAYELINK